MEALIEKVYECTLAVEAHMICDLLARAGISARVEGEFLAGAGGDLPLGNTIKVRVDPARAVEAREVIDEWERIQPDPAPLPPRSRLQSPLWFLLGALIGGAFIFIVFRSPYTSSRVDTDEDGIDDEFYYYSGQTIDRIEYDRNDDRRIDERWIYDFRGVPSRYEADDDFDGRFEVQGETERGHIVTWTRDMNGDGRPDLVSHLAHGVVQSVDVYDEAGRRIRARQHFNTAWNDATEFDDDGDGIFERHVEYDRFGEPKSR